ncbi:hypothetical protein C8R45DRAFT_1047858 [Mycena sanguinolenta]|nr:hypothetical protein C8R45DRAFT_1047858 [Mycena sanguinolenta]
MLLPGDYYFCLEDQEPTFKYRVCLKFENWTPPPAVPLLWLFDNRTSDAKDLRVTNSQKGSSHSVLVRDRDGECVMTGDTDLRRLDSAHLIPQKEATWYIDHELADLASDDTSHSVESLNNQIVLRTDLNGRGLDTADFCFVPYRKCWISLWMDRGSPGLATQYNYTKVILPPRIRARYLHCRFAWNIFQLISRNINVVSWLNSDEDDDDGEQDEEQDEDEETDQNNDTGEEDEEEDNDPLPRRNPPRGGRSPALPSRGRGGGRGGGSRGRGGGSRGRGGSGGRTSGKRSNRSNKRCAEEELEGPTIKKRRQGLGDVLDISRLTPDFLARMKLIDQQISKDLHLRKSVGKSPGFSHFLQLELEYRQRHPAATDPGNARIAFVSEREELQEFHDHRRMCAT